MITVKITVWRLGVPSSLSLKGLKKMIFIAVVFFFFDPTLALPEFCVSSVEEEEEEFQRNESQKRFMFVLFHFTA